MKFSCLAAVAYLFEFMPSSLNPLAKGLLSIFSLVICKRKHSNHEPPTKELPAPMADIT